MLLLRRGVSTTRKHEHVRTVGEELMRCVHLARLSRVRTRGRAPEDDAYAAVPRRRLASVHRASRALSIPSAPITRSNRALSPSANSISAPSPPPTTAHASPLFEPHAFPRKRVHHRRCNSARCTVPASVFPRSLTSAERDASSDSIISCTRTSNNRCPPFARLATTRRKSFAAGACASSSPNSHSARASVEINPPPRSV